MLAHEIMTEVVAAVRPDDPLALVLNWMEIFRLRHLPVVDGGRYVGLVSDEQIYDLCGAEGQARDLCGPQAPPSVAPDAHILQVVEVAAERSLTAVPVADAQGRYLGLVILPDLLAAAGKLLSAGRGGATLVLEIPAADYSLLKIADIVEENGARALSLFTRPTGGGARTEVTLRVSANEVTSILRGLERHEYTVTRVINGVDDMREVVREHYQSLMRYLSV